MNIKQTKEYLSSYRNCMARAHRLRIDAAQYTACAESINKEIEDCVKQSSKIESLITGIGDMMEREILIRKYIYGETIELIAEKLNYSPRHVQRLIDKAICSINKDVA